MRLGEAEFTGDRLPRVRQASVSNAEVFVSGESHAIEMSGPVHSCR